MTAGRVVVDRAGRQWLSDRKSAADRSKPLADLISLNFRDSFSRRRLERQLEDISDSVAERLKVMSEMEYSSLDENDKMVALEEATRALSVSDLSDQAIFGVDTEGRELARIIIAENRTRASQLGLPEAGERFYELVVQECCECLVQIVQQLPQYNARAATEILGRLSGVATSISVALSRIPVRRLESPDGEEFDSEFKNRYMRLVAESLSQVEVFGVPVNNYSARTTLSIAYISLSVTAEWDVDAEQDEVMQSMQGGDSTIGSSKSFRVESVLAQNSKHLIRGEAGSGKSTLLHWIATSSVRSAFKGELASWNGLIPFLIKLRSYPEGDLPGPEDFVRAAMPSIAGVMPAGWVHRQLSSSQAILLVDGVDELPGGRRAKVRAWLRGLIIAYPELRVIVTSRPSAAASSWLSSDGFRSAQLDRMTPTDVREFVSHWHAAILDSGVFPCEPQELPKYERALLSRISNQPHLQSLATTPLLAAMLCALNLDRRTQLPRDRMGLYAAALELLLERRDAERQIPSYFEVSLERRQKVLILQDLAWRLSMTNRSEIPKSAVLRRVQEKIDTMPRLTYSAEAVLDHLIQRSGVIREPIVGRIDFIHRTFQEYLTAKQAAEDGDVEPFIAKSHLDQWRDTVIMTAGHANSPLRHELIEGLLERIDREPRYRRPLRLLVSACFETMPDVPRDLSTRIDDCFRCLVPPKNNAEATSLPRAGDAILNFFPESLDGLSEAASVNTVKSAYLINGPEALRLLGEYARDSRDAVHRELVYGWDHYESEEYSAKVLSSAPFTDGVFHLGSSEHLPYVPLLPQVRSLEFDGTVEDASMLEPVRHLTTQFHGRILGPDCAELGKHARLRDVILMGSEACDISWVEGNPKLRYLRVWSGVTDVSPLRHLNLRLLGLAELEGLDNFDPIWEFEELSWLILRGCSQLVDMEPISRLVDLRTLVLDRPGGINGIRHLLDSRQIEWMGIQGFKDGISISDCNSASLEMLDLTGSAVTDSRDPIALPKLRQLHLGVWEARELPNIQSLGMLRKFTLERAMNLEDISPLLELPNLKEVSIGECSPELDLTSLTARGIKVEDPRMQLIHEWGKSARNVQEGDEEW
ncbi:NACHT domain-containing protein [Streptomyces griseoincarnatus]